MKYTQEQIEYYEFIILEALRSHDLPIFPGWKDLALKAPEVKAQNDKMHKELSDIYPFLRDNLDKFEGILYESLKLKLERIDELLKEIEL